MAVGVVVIADDVTGATDSAVTLIGNAPLTAVVLLPKAIVRQQNH